MRPEASRDPASTQNQVEAEPAGAYTVRVRHSRSCHRSACPPSAELAAVCERAARSCAWPFPSAFWHHSRTASRAAPNAVAGEAGLLNINLNLSTLIELPELGGQAGPSLEKTMRESL